MSAATLPLTRHPWVALLTVSFGLFVAMLDSTIVNIAVPAIILGLHATLDLTVWVLNSYILVLAALYLTGGRLGDRLGPRRSFVAGMVTFTVASIVCGLSGSVGELIAARAVQGAGAALLTPQVMVIAVALFPVRRRGVALGFVGAVTSIAAVLGPSLGGLLVDRFGWRSVFFVNVPIGTIAALASLFTVPALRGELRPRLDLAGLVLGTSGLGLLSFGLIEGERYRWGQVVSFVSIPLIIAVGVVLLVLFALSQRSPGALVPGRLIRAPDFSAMSTVTFAAQFALYGMYLPLSIYLQSALALNPLLAGLELVSLPVASAAAAPTAGYLTDRFGGRRVLLAGLLLSTAGTVLLIFSVGSHDSGWRLQPSLVACGVGLGLTFTPVMALAMRRVPRDIVSGGAALLNTARLFGNVLAAAVVGAVLQSELAGAMIDRAGSAAARLPVALRGDFLALLYRASAKSVLTPGGLTGPTGGRPPIPPELAATLQSVFADSFVVAMRVSLIPCAAVLVLAIVLIVSRRGSSVSDGPAEAG